MQPIGHPESVDPGWFQQLVRTALERKLRSPDLDKFDMDDRLYEAMWYVWDLRENLTDLYYAGRENLEGGNLAG